jgi:pimeloyl-ACP methyl ester carboxylesterase
MSEPVADRTPESVDVAGPEDGPPIVLVHGTVFNRTMWAPQREALSEEFRIVVPDLPGHGDRRGEPFRLEEGVETVGSLVDSLDEDSVHLVGLSLGGYVATAFADRHPERVEGLVVASSSANPVGLLGSATTLVGKAALLASRSDLVERAVDGLTSRWVESRDLSPETTSEIVRSGFDLEPFGRAGVEIAGEDFRQMFAGFDGPSLVVNGEYDFLMRRGEDAHAGAAPDADVTVVDGAGHVTNLDRPRVFEGIVHKFVATAEFGRTPPP